MSGPTVALHTGVYGINFLTSKWVNGGGSWLNFYVPKHVVVSTSQGLAQELNALLSHIFSLQAQSVIHWCEDGHFTCVKTDTFQQCGSTRDVCAFLLHFLLSTSQAQTATTLQNRTLLLISLTAISMTQT